MVFAYKYCITDESTISWAIKCNGCGGQHISLPRAIALASEVDTLEQWFGLIAGADEPPS
jgi:hypothetical protein